MRSTFSALVIAAGLLGFGAAAQATPLSAALPAGAAAPDSAIVHVQMGPGERRMRHREHRMMRHHRRMERRMRHRERRMMHRERRMMHRGM